MTPTQARTKRCHVCGGVVLVTATDNPREFDAHDRPASVHGRRLGYADNDRVGMMQWNCARSA